MTSVYPPPTASSFVYFREIPMFAKFSTETRSECDSRALRSEITETELTTNLPSPSCAPTHPTPASSPTRPTVIAYDDKWCYILTRFLIPYSKSSKRAPSRSYATGRDDVTVCACVLSKLCFKRGRLPVTPEKVFTLSGMVGPAEASLPPKDITKNWDTVNALRKQKGGIKNWIQDHQDDGRYILGTKERNDKALDIIHRLNEADRGAWLELDALQ